MHTDQPKDVQQADSDGAAAAPAAGNEAKFDKGAYFIGAHVHNEKIQGLLVPPVQLRPRSPWRSQLALGTLARAQSGHQVLFVQDSRTQEAGRMWSPSFCLAPLLRMRRQGGVGQGLQNAPGPHEGSAGRGQQLPPGLLRQRRRPAGGVARSHGLPPDPNGLPPDPDAQSIPGKLCFQSTLWDCCSSEEYVCHAQA